MRREKGKGTVSKMSGNRNMPYMVRVRDGTRKNEKTGKKEACYKIIGYTKTKKEGIIMLNKYITEGKFYSGMTFEMVYQEFRKFKFPTISDSFQNAHENAYKICKPLHHEIFANIDLAMLQELIDYSGKNYPTLRKVKLLLTQMYDYAIKNDLCLKNYAKGISIRQYTAKRIPSYKREKISKKDIKIFWMKSSLPYYQMIIFMIYTGVRVSEMLNIKKENVNLDEQYIDIVEGKNDNSIRRIPVADVIFPFVYEWYYRYEMSEYLFSTEGGKKFQYRNYYDSYFKPLVEDLEQIYTPHWCRHTFVSLMSEAEVDPVMIKKIVGHSTNMAVTERIYTHYEVEAMLREVNKLEEWSELESEERQGEGRTSTIYGKKCSYQRNSKSNAQRSEIH